MLTVFPNGTLVNNETTSNDISVYLSLLISSLGIFLIRSDASKVSFSEYLFCVRGFSGFAKYFRTLQCLQPIVSIIGRELGALSNELLILGNS